MSTSNWIPVIEASLDALSPRVRGNPGADEVRRNALRVYPRHPPQCILILSLDLVMSPKPGTPLRQFPHDPRRNQMNL